MGRAVGTSPSDVHVRSGCANAAFLRMSDIYPSGMTADQSAALISFGVPAILCSFIIVGYRLGARKALKVLEARLQQERASRVERWTPPPPQPSGEPGTPTRLLSDYEDAIYAEARHAVAAAFGRPTSKSMLLWRVNYTVT